ncbi:MAG: hypothetical protein V3U24_09900 [Candidatus Neomarinimicrobiota bacterium]
MVKFGLRGGNAEYSYHINTISRILLADGTLVYSAQKDRSQSKQSLSGLSFGRILGICCLGGLALVFIGGILRQTAFRL